MDSEGLILEGHGPESCAACGAPVREGSRFCGQCGNSLQLEKTTADPAAGRRRQRKRSNLATAGDRLWQQLKPALWLWAILLVTNGALGGLSHLVDISSPRFDLAVTVIDALAICLFCLSDQGSLRPLLSRSGMGPNTWYLAPALLALIFVFMSLYFMSLGALGVEELSYLEDFESHGWPLWSALVLICFCPAVFEELAFRGYIQSRLARSMSTRESLLVQAGLFSFIHMVPLIFVSHFVIGLLFGYLRNRTGSLYPGILLHMAWNALVVLDEARRRDLW